MITHASEINYSDPQEIRENLRHLTARQGICLDSAFSPYKLNNLRYQQSYFDNAGFIIAAAPSFMLEFGRCGIPNATNPSGRCKKRQYCTWCSRCSYLPYRSNFNASFNAGDFSFATFSWNGSIPSGPGVVDSCLNHWDAIDAGLKHVRSESLLSGYLAVEEMSVRSFMPAQVLPHVHCIVEGAVDAEELAQEATQVISCYLRDQDSALVPNIQILPMPDEESFQNRLEYMFKPIKLKDAYELAWFENCPAGDRSQGRQLNSQVKDFVLGFTEMTKYRKQVRSWGSMYSTSSTYVGKRRQRRPGRRNKK